MLAFALDPTLVYSVLIIGLWLTVTAMYIPGTGIAEGIAFLTLVAAFVGLVYMPTNWISVMLLVGGMGAFATIPFISPQHTRWTDMALVVQGIGSVFLFKGTMANPLIIALMLGLAFAYNRFLLLPLMAKLRDMPIIIGDSLDELVGATGRATSDVDADGIGTAQIDGEMWTIRSSVSLQKGDVVRVIAVEGLELHVERLKSKRPPEQLESVEYHNGTEKPEKV